MRYALCVLDSIKEQWSKHDENSKLMRLLSLTVELIHRNILPVSLYSQEHEVVPFYGGMFSQTIPDHIAESMKCVQPLFDQYGAVWGIRSYSTVQKHSSLNDARCPDCRTFI